MANTYVLYTADGTQQLFTVPFPYINRTDVLVYINNIQVLTPATFEWVNDQTIVFFGAPLSQYIVKIQRSTNPNTPDVTYQNGAILTASDLNTATLQAFYRTQELQDELDAYISGGLSLITTNNGNDAEAMIQAAAQAVLNSALLADLQSQIGDIQANAETIIAQTSRVDTLQTVIDGLTNYDGIGIETYVANEVTNRIDGDTALAEVIALIGASNGTNSAFIINMTTAQVDATTSLGDYLTGIISSVAAANASISSESTARTTADTALATLITNLTATVGSNTAAIGTEATARATGDSANASSISALATTVAGNGAAITTEQTARATGDSANASSISSLSTTVAGHTASLSTAATSISGLQAQYTVKVDVDGHVAGFGLASTAVNGTPISSMIFNVNNFAIVDPGNGLTAPTVPFNVTGGVVYMQNVVIGNALIGSMTIGKLTQGSLNADMAVGTGKIVFDNGAFMKVIGVGFGTLNQFIEWFGPHQASYSTCSEANAIAYLKVNGDAYFGGTLLAGVLHNAVQAGVLNSTNVADLGPFSSNGNTITITASFSMHANTIFLAGATAAYSSTPKQTPSATVVLSRSINGGGFVDVSTMNVTGTWSGDAPTGGDPGHYTQDMAASTTFVDPDHLAQNREYKLRFTAFTNVNATILSNILAIQSNE